MTPQPSIAHYRISGKLGEGGMGAVYRATDTKLNREVAIKVLPDVFANDPDRLARFTREAQVLASLNHPHIAAIYSVEDRAIVLELVEGPHLAGPLAEEQALPIIEQLIDALEYAHEKGIVHRDLKPANLKLTSDGRLKVLDFGLAKALASDPQPSDPAVSPTLTMRATMAGVIMGTAAYMSPEQARGQTVDKRADIWSFGVVLYELLTGRQLFAGETVSDILAAVLTRDPDVSAVPLRFQRLLRLCLTRDPRKRLRDISAARILLEETVAPTEVPARQSPSKLPWVVSALVSCVAVAALFFALRTSRPSPQPFVRLPIDLSEDELESMAVSPDGRYLAYVGRHSGVLSLAIRRLDETKSRVVPETQRAANPFFSPDGQWVGYFGLGKLFKVNVEGGQPIAVAPIVLSGQGSAAWGPDGTIVFSTNGPGGLWRVPDSGGVPQRLTDPTRDGQVTHRWPQFLPGGKAVLFTANRSLMSFDDAEIDILNLPTSQWSVVQKLGYFGRYLPSGHLAFIRQGTLMAVRLDPDRPETAGQTVPVLTEVAADPSTGDGRFDCSSGGATSGMCIVRNGRQANLVYNATWLEESGKTRTVFPKQGTYFSPRFSPDGRLLAVSIGGPIADIHLWDPARESLTQLSFTHTQNRYPVFTPDGRHLVFHDNQRLVWWVRTDGGGNPQKLFETDGLFVPCSFSPDGRRLSYFALGKDSRQDIWTLPIDTTDPEHPKAGQPEVFLATPNGESSPMFSPDGHWLAYNSDESGSMEIYVRPFPGPGGKWLVSSGGGSWASWSQNGKRLFYKTPDGSIMAVDYTAKGDAFTAAKPVSWGPPRAARQHVTSTFRNWDMSPDGHRAILLTDSDSAPENTMKLTALFNFFDELKRVVQ